MPSESDENRDERLIEFESRSALGFLQTLPRFTPGYEGTDNMFYFFSKIIIFKHNKEEDDVRSVYVSYLS